ncbi:unnamed protein product [Protopolystoma xenopodis]|uniref:Uncharacterized protein n=1 Tax=Protopolystoma xenopodis TaxID=117903 RepID=A0A448WJR5_9PLAT|nr:unnamed protein product [Protopolystoma xenopodis]
MFVPPCTFTVTLTCSEGYLSVCYSPHRQEPYQRLIEYLVSERSVVQLASSPPPSDSIFFGGQDDSSKTGSLRFAETFEEGDAVESRDLLEAGIATADDRREAGNSGGLVDLTEYRRRSRMTSRPFTTASYELKSAERARFDGDELATGRRVLRGFGSNATGERRRC